jgi:hypothetical protein
MDKFEPHKGIHVNSEQRDLEGNIDHFAAEMAKLYNNDDARAAKGLPALEAILGRKLVAASIGSAYSGGHYLGPHNPATCIVEFKNETVDINAIPVTS